MAQLKSTPHVTLSRSCHAPVSRSRVTLLSRCCHTPFPVWIWPQGGVGVQEFGLEVNQGSKLPQST